MLVTRAIEKSVIINEEWVDMFMQVLVESCVEIPDSLKYDVSMRFPYN